MAELSAARRIGDSGRLQRVRKIAVLRASSLGDFVFCLPAMEALRFAYPRAEIVYLGRPWHKEFLRERRWPIDRAVVVPVSQGVRDEEDGSTEDPQEVARFLKEMQQEHFDMALQLHGGGEHTNPFVRKLGARLSVGLQAPGAEPLDIAVPYEYFQNEIARCLEVVSRVGAPLITLQPHVAVTDADIAEVRQALGDLHEPYIVLQVGAHDPRRRWPAERYAAVGDHLARQGYHMLVAGGSDVAELAQAVTGGMSHPAQNAAGRLSLSGTAGLLSRARLVISNDSGPLHLADAVGAATVGLYWVGNLVNFGTLYRGRHIPLLSWTTHCPECGVPCMQGNLPAETAPRCEHVSCFITDISVEAVCAAADRLLRTTDRKAEGDGQVTEQDR